MNKKEKNKNKPRIPGSRRSWKHAIFTSLSQGSLANTRPTAQQDVCGKTSCLEAQVPRLASHIHTQCSCITSPRRSRTRTPLLGIMAPVTRDVFHGHFTVLSRVWNPTGRLCIILEARPSTHPHPYFFHAARGPLAEAGDTKQRKSQQNTDSAISHRCHLAAQALDTVMLPRCCDRSRISRKFSLESRLGQAGHPPSCC